MNAQVQSNSSEPPAGTVAAVADEKPWYSETNKEFVANKGFKTGDDAITWGQNLEKLIGLDRAGRTIVKPKDDKDVEGIKAYRTALGVPESAEAYELPLPEGDKGEFAKTAATWFHENGVPKAAAQGIAAKWNEFMKQAVDAQQAEAVATSEKALGDLKVEWGDKFEANSETARRFLREAGWPEEKVKLYELTFGTGDMLKTFASLGTKLGESKFVAGEGGNKFTSGAQSAQAEIQTLMAKRKSGAVSEKEYLAQMDRLGPLAYPDPAAK